MEVFRIDVVTHDFISITNNSVSDISSDFIRNQYPYGNVIVYTVDHGAFLNFWCMPHLFENNIFQDPLSRRTNKT